MNMTRVFPDSVRELKKWIWRVFSQTVREPKKMEMTRVFPDCPWVRNGNDACFPKLSLSLNMLVHVKVSGEKEFISKRDKTTRLILENQDLKGTVSQDMRYSFFFL